jgi:hypothetical protein
LGADVIMSKTALESIMAQNYKIPLAYIEYADGIYSLLTKIEMSNLDWLLIYSIYGSTAISLPLLNR